MAIGTRLISTLIPLMFAALVCGAFTAYAMFSMPLDEAIVSILFWAIAVLGTIVCAGCFGNAWRKQIISSRDVVIWCGVWVLTAWLLHGVMPAPPNSAAIPGLLHGELFAPSESEAAPKLNVLLGWVACTAYASLLPLPFAALALDVARRRHGATPAQDPEQHRAIHVASNNTQRFVIRAIAATVALAMLWLGWRGTPGYVKYLRAKGWPASTEELAAAHAIARGAENLAVRYVDIANEAVPRSQIFFTELKDNTYARSIIVNGKPIWTQDLIIGAGDAKIPESGPIDPVIWEFSEHYWTAVAKPIAPKLIEVASMGTQAASYPIDFDRGYAGELSHLAKLRSLARILLLDTVHWSLLNDPQKAQDSTLAILPLQQSLATEPFIISQLVRIAILSISLDSLECLMNRTTPTDGQLAQLQESFAHALPPVSEARILDIAMRGECIMGLSALNELSLLDGKRQQVEASDLLERLLFPVAAEQITLVRSYESVIDFANSPTTVTPVNEIKDSQAFAPLSSGIMGGIYRAYESEWRIRTNLDIAQAAIAVERFRRAEGRLPEQLGELVPRYMAATPKDYYSSAPVRYARQDDGSFMIYSIGRNQRDDHGQENKDSKSFAFDDYAFSVTAQKS